jgi:hypothetical protein
MTKPRIIRRGDESESDLSEVFAALHVIAFSENCSLLARFIGRIFHFLLSRGHNGLGDLLSYS